MKDKAPAYFPNKSPIRFFFFLLLSLQFGTCTLPADVIINPASCSSNNDCPNFFYPVCDPGTSQCVHACTNTDCDRFSGTGLGVCTSARCYVTCSTASDPICNAMRAYCGTSSSPVRCYQCGNDAQCQNAGYGANSFCDSTTISGFGVCSSCPNTGCTVGTCQNYKCVECTSDSYCLTNSPTKPHCEHKFEENLCQECYLNSHCTSVTKSLCSSNSCNICASHPDCTHLTATPYCAGGTTGCVQCTQDSHCPSTGTPYCVGNTCQACSTGICSGRFSSTTPTKLACLVSSGVCVECNSDTDCPTTGKPYCVGNTCQACSTSICSARFSSTTPTKLACLTSSGVCVQCNSDGDCPSTGTPYCNSGSNICEACTTGICNGRFSSTTPTKLVCLASSGVCAECNSDSDCPTTGKPYCVGNTCQACSTSICSARFSSTAPTKLACLTSSGVCVQCTGDGDCPSTGTPYCDSSSNTCGACSTSICSNRFSSTTPTKLNCQASSGVCVQCNGDSDCPTTGTPYCSGTNICQACSTTICSARFSSTTPTKLACDAGTGVCIGCQGNSDCPSVTESFCNAQSCTQCTQDSHCTHISGKNKCYLGECYTYQAQCPSMYSNIGVNQNQNVFTIKVPSILAAQIDIVTSLQFSLQGVATSDYTYTLTKSSSTVFVLTFTFDKTIPATVLKLTIPCPPQPGYLYGDITVSFSTEKVLYSTPEIQQTVETIQSLTSTAATAMTSVSGSMMFAGANPAILWALINLLQMFYYMVFINVEYPVNVQPFFQLFTMGNLSFIPNPIGWIFSDINDVTLDAPKKFLDNDVNGLFFQEAGNMLLIWMVVSVGYLASYLFLRYTRNMPKLLTSIASKTVSIFEWSGVFRTLITSYTQLTLCALLQMRVLTYRTTLLSFSSIFGIIFVVLAGVVPYITWFVLNRFHSRPKIMKFKFSTLIEELKMDSKHFLSKYFNVLFLIRRLVMVTALVFLHDYPYIEISVLLLSCVLWIAFLCHCLPYESKLNNVINIFSEIVFTGVHVLIFLLIHDDFTDWLTDQQRMDFGWGIMGGCGIILVASLVSSFVQQFFALKKFFKLIMQVIKGKGGPKSKTPKKILNTPTSPSKRKIKRFPPRKTYPEVSRASVENTRASIERGRASIERISPEGSLGDSQKSFISSAREINLEIEGFESHLKKRRKSSR